MATLVYDGDCAFCRRCVAWAARRTADRVQYVPYQEAELVAEDAARAPDTIVWRNGKTRIRSSAAIRVLWSMHPGWRLAGTALWLVPKPIRDAGYRWVGRRWGPLPRR